MFTYLSIKNTFTLYIRRYEMSKLNCVNVYPIRLHACQLLLLLYNLKVVRETSIKHFITWELVKEF